MLVMNKGWLLGGLILVWLTLAGCQSAPTASSAAARPTGGFNGHVAVIPASELSFLPEHFAFLYPMVDDAVAAWLERNGLRAAPPGLVRDALSADGGQLRAGIQSNQSEELSLALSELIGKLSKTEPVDLVIIPQLMANSRMLSRPYRGATWDGVQRAFTINGSRDAGRQLQADTATLVVGVYNHFGQLAYFGRGGVDFLENATRAGGGIVTSPKQPGQVSAASVDEAVNLALDPWARSMDAVVGNGG